MSTVEVDDANPFDAAEDFTIHNLRIDPAPGHPRASDISDVDSPRAGAADIHPGHAAVRSGRPPATTWATLIAVLMGTCDPSGPDPSRRPRLRMDGRQL